MLAFSRRKRCLLLCLVASVFVCVGRMPAPITVEPDPTPAEVKHKARPKPKRESPPRPRDHLTSEERQLIGDYQLETKTLDTTELSGSYTGSGDIKVFMDDQGNLSASGSFECNNSYFYKKPAASKKDDDSPPSNYTLSATGNVTGLLKITTGKQYRLWGKIDWNISLPAEAKDAARDNSSGVSDIEFIVSGGEKRCFISPPFAAPRLTPNFVAR